MSDWRLLVDGSGPGAWNMALDEAILDRYAEAATPQEPTLRLYGWSPAALSLGRGQPVSHCAPEVLHREGIDLVRRPTGGQAVLHQHERTFAVIASLRRAPFPGGVLETYRRVAAALAEALRLVGVRGLRAAEAAAAGRTRRGIAACFDTVSRYEPLAQGRKLAGAAQLRRRGAFLQHVSLPVRADRGRLAAALGGRVRGRFFTLAEALGREPLADEIDRALCGGFERVLGARLMPGQPTPGERDRAAQLCETKYRDPDWIGRGQVLA